MSRLRRITARAATALAALLVFLALVVPDQVTRMPPGTPWWPAVVRVPIEAIAVLTVLLVLPRRARTVTATVLGALLGVLTVLKIIDIGFFAVLSRAFDPVLDWPLFADGYRFVRDSSGPGGLIGALAGVIVLAVGVLAGSVLAVRRLATVTARHRTAARAGLASAAVAWLLLALAGTSFAPGVHVASDSMATLTRDSVLSVPAALRDRREFDREVDDDAYQTTPPTSLLTALRGKDVVFAVVESYGRSAVQDPTLSGPVTTALSAGTKSLTAAGFTARSGFLTSPTAGGGSWLAHSTFQSGVWIDNEQRYRGLVSGDRLTLTGALAKTGAWRTVGVEPGVTYAWPEGSFYGYQQVYDSHTLGYAGPVFGWAPVPDQFTLKTFTDREYAVPGRGPLAAEITFVSSHTPWAPQPVLEDWNKLGDGSLYTQQHAAGRSATDVWKDPAQVREAYSQSIVYTLDSLVSWVTTYGNDNLVLVVYGDHQPAPIVVGDNASRDVPVSIITHDQSVLDRVAGWGWTDGLQPAPAAPVWPMNDFRDKFLTAFGPTGTHR
ncbi:sulfatase [Symbioplanes lichenis]|uniref:sulfatase n=1 Tax=Symbioplanes lichenis TaxID=1629072 RepID=UPI002739FBA2|nr:sulfatase [Actinoplanes lichenis]